MRVVDVEPTYSELDGTPKDVPNDIHHHDETLVGPIDPWLTVRVAAATRRLVTYARAGVSFPIGRTEPDPYELAAEGKWHEHIQFGTGTFVPIVGFGLSYATPPIETSVSFQGMFSLYEDRYGYRAPSRSFGELRFTLPLSAGKLRPFVCADVAHEADELWHGQLGAEGRTIRTTLLAGGGLVWQFAPTWQADLGLRVRLAELSPGATLDYPGLVQAGVSTTFDFAKNRRAAR